MALYEYCAVRLGPSGQVASKVFYAADYTVAKLLWKEKKHIWVAHNDLDLPPIDEFDEVDRILKEEGFDLVNIVRLGDGWELYCDASAE